MCEIVSYILAAVSFCIGVALLVISSFWLDNYAEVPSSLVCKIPLICEARNLYIAGGSFGIIAAVIQLIGPPVSAFFKQWKQWATAHFVICVFALLAFILPMCTHDGLKLTDIAGTDMPTKINTGFGAGVTNRRAIAWIFMIVTILDFTFSPVVAGVVWCLNRDSGK